MRYEIPGDAEAWTRFLAAATRDRAAVRVRGAGTKDHLGDPAPVDVVALTSGPGCVGVVDHVPADLTVTVRAGTRFADLQRALASRGQFLPLDPPFSAEATVGGIIAADSCGFGAFRYGGVRDLLIGASVALADGTLAHAGGRVVKNVAGYDLCKLVVGSLGTLGVVTEATFKVLPLPVERAVAVVGTSDAGAAFARADALVRTSLRPIALVVERVARTWRLVVAAAGEPPVVERTMREAGGERDDDVERVLAPLRDVVAVVDGAVVRAAVPLAAQRAFADAAAQTGAFSRLVADAATGLVRVHLRGDDALVIGGATALLASARALGGHARIERRAIELVPRLAAWPAEPAGLFLMRRLKERFDPAGILEPGRLPL